MSMSGRAHKFGNDINTDYIIPVKRKRDTLNDSELAKYIMEDIAPDFYNQITDGDFIVAGRNFGCGSSREVAPRVIQAAGIKAVIAESFARIFYRNAINIGLILIESKTDLIDSGDFLDVSLDKSFIYNHQKNIYIKTKPLPKIMREILECKGLVPYLKLNGDFKIK